MITKDDPRVSKGIGHKPKLELAIDETFRILPKLDGGNVGNYNYGYREYELDVDKVMEQVDKILIRYDFDVDARECKHAFGIGNNNEWNIVDKELEPFAELHCTDDMFGGVIVYFTMNGDRLGESLKLKPYMYRWIDMIKIETFIYY